jgi:endonuclease G
MRNSLLERLASRLVVPGLALAAVLSAAAAPAVGAETTEADPRYCRTFSGYGGFPRHRGAFVLDGHQRICRPGYALLHNGATRTPDWVVEVLTRAAITGTVKRKDNFAPDPALPEGVGATPGDYRRSGFDRGHMAPAADFKSDQVLMNDSFFMSNMSPQVGPSFNRGIWAQLEERARDLARSRGRLVVLTGPIYDAYDLLGEDFIGPGTKEIANRNDPARRVRVPDGYFKILSDPDRRRALAFALPNQRLPGRDIEEFRVTIRLVEDMTGLNFFPEFDARTQNILEANEGEMWHW